MLRELLILRHGQAERQDLHGDQARDLTDEGKRGRPADRRVVGWERSAA